MLFDIITIFPEVFPGPLSVGVVGRALKSGLIGLNVINLRDFTADRHRSVDDYPYGGGPGMVLKPEPVFTCLDQLANPKPYIILLSPQGTVLTQSLANELAQGHQRIAFICGRYEGVDERIRLYASDLDLSIGDYVISGGETAAMVLIETIARQIPGVIGDTESVSTDSFSEDLLKFPQYTRPEEFRGYYVPQILLSGDHAKIAEWRRTEALNRTRRNRPDLFSCNPPPNDDNKHPSE